MKCLQIKVVKTHSVQVFGSTKTWAPGAILWEGEAPPPSALSDRAGLHPDGWKIMVGHGRQELIPKEHLEINRFEYARSWAGLVPWDEFCAAKTGSSGGAR